jgi:hypothetical protein
VSAGLPLRPAPAGMTPSAGHCGPTRTGRPAHAGMTRAACWAKASTSGRPRTGRDDSFVSTIGESNFNSAPHTQGWLYGCTAGGVTTWLRPAPQGWSVVVHGRARKLQLHPAHAGLTQCARPHCADAALPPRTGRDSSNGELKASEWKTFITRRGQTQPREPVPQTDQTTAWARGAGRAAGPRASADLEGPATAAGPHRRKGGGVPAPPRRFDRC